MSIQKGVLIFIFLISVSFQSFSQRGKDGAVTINAVNVIINEYTTLTTDASAGTTSITVAASGLNANGRFAASLSTGDLIMIIQMQGATLSGGAVEVPAGSGIFQGIPNNSTLGSIVSYNNCGNYEFCEVNSVPNATNITVDCGLIHSYTAAGRVQIVRVPRYSSLVLNSPGAITGTTWGAAYIGGVVAIEVQNNTVINVGAQIGAGSIGFRGGGLAPLNPTGFGGTQYAGTSFTVGSNKGEGIGGYGADYNTLGGQYGRGAFANGGGGGDCHNAGGGGGANASSLLTWDGQGNPSVAGGAGWVSAWDLESPGFSAHTSGGGGRGGYSTSLTDQNATITGTNNALWGGDNRQANGGLGGRPLDYSTGKIFMGGGGGAGDRDNGAAGVGMPGGGIVYIMNYGTLSGGGSIVAPGGACLNSGFDGAAGGGGGGTIIINSVGTLSGITASVNGGPGGTQFLIAGSIEAEGPGGGGGAGYLATAGGAITQIGNGGNNGTTNSAGLTEFPPNGATKGASGLINQLITHDTITVADITICNGNTATLTASINGPIGATIYWYTTLVGGAPIATGPTYTTPPLFATATYYAGFCPGTYRKPIVVTVIGVTIVPAPITGPTPICPNATGMVYSLPAVAGITYTWTVPAGATITSGQGTNQITVNFGTTGGTVSVIQSNICRSDPAITMAVSVTPLPVATPITGTTPVCPTASGVVYSVANVALSTYAWTVPPGATITSGQGTNQITVNFAGTGGNVSVIQSNPCGVAPAVNFPVAIFPLPVTSAITGTTPVCPNQTGLIFSVTNVVGDTYAWTVPAGTSITAGQGTNQITVNWGNANGTVSVIQTNICGAGAAVNLAVVVTQLPVTSAITGTTPVCPTAAGVVYSVTNIPGDTYAWTVPAGATITSGQGTNQITVTFAGTGGNVSVTESNVCGPGVSVNFPVAIFPLPVTSAIAGTTPVCPNQTGLIYSVTNVVGNTYAWTVPAGATITAGQGTNQITVNWGGANGTISVIQTNICGPGAAVNLAVVVTQLPVTSAITGTTPVCPTAAGVIYSATNVPGDTYAWTVPVGATITSGQGTNQITVTFAGTGGNVSVTESNVCGPGVLVNFPVAIFPLPVTSAIAGTTPVCPNQTGLVYSVTNVVGNTYAWTVPAGSTITAGQGSNQITVNWGSANGTVSVVQTNICGPGAAVNMAVAVTPLPVTSAITGTTPVCPNTAGVSYSVTNTPGDTYAWTVPAGATITAGQGTNQITVNFGTTGGTISVVETNVCGPGPAVNYALVVTPIPVTTPIIGPSPVCLNAPGIAYSVTNVAGNTYSWTVTGGATIASGQGTNQIAINWGAAGGTVSVIESNVCGIGAAVSLPVAITLLPVTSAITGTSPICANAAGVLFSVVNTTGSTYAWTVPAGATLVSGQGSNQISVNFGPTGGNVTVTETGTCGVGATVNYAVAILPPPVTSAITGTTPVCPNTTGVIYSVTNIAGDTYAWTVPTGAAITAGQGTNQITVTFGATPGNVSVIETNMCGSGPAVNFAVAISPLPTTSAITGSSPVCLNASGITYSVTNTIGNTYAWTVPAGAVITAGQGTNQITVSFGVTSGTVSVIETNNCGPGTAVNFPVTITQLPVTSVITGTTPVCPNAVGVVFSVTNTVGNTYAWTVPAGATITAGQGTNQITVTFGATASTVSVVESNNCGPGTAINFAVTTYSLPVTSTITGTTPVCPNATGAVYSVTNTVGNTYAWTVPAGATITAGQGTNQITVNFGATAGTVSVAESNNCGPGTAVNFVVTTFSLPVTSAITGTTPVCPNTTGVVYSVTNTVGNTYAWTVPAGATITAGQGTNQITVDFGTTPGNVSVVETNNCGPGAAVNFAVAIFPLPTTSAITGITPVCLNATGITYSVTNTIGNTYAWTVPAGAVITAGQGTNQITVSFGVTSGTVSVIETNNCGPGAAVNFAVGVTTLPVTSVITGTTPVCPNTAGVIYSVTNTAGSTYAWTVPAGSVITAGQGTNQITVTIGTNAGNVSVIETNNCGPGAAVNFAVAISPLPVTSAITGTTPVCPNATGVVYSVTNTVGNTYAWTVPAGATITAGQGTNQITVNFGATAGNVSVIETNNCGPGAAVNFAVTLFSLPVTSAITGTTPVCPNTAGVTFSVTNTVGNTYAWAVPVGASITAGQGTNQITVTFGSNSGNVSVIETNNCGPGAAVNFAVVVTSLPATSVITGPATVCLNTTGVVYSVTNTVGNTYAWTVPAGATITAGQGTNQITVTFGVTSGNVSVIETNNCGPGTAVSLAVGVTLLPVTSAITGTTPVCPNATGIIYSVTNTAGSTFNWSVPAGASITAGQGTNQITVSFGAAGVGTVSVTETGTCGAGTAVSYNVTISAPAPPVVVSPLTYCQNDVAPALTSTGAGLLWYTAAAGGSGNALSPTPSTLVAGTTNYYVSQTIASCESARDTISVLVNPLPIVTVTSPTICNGAVATMTAAGAVSYTWSAGVTAAGASATASPVVTTTYTVTGSTLGCVATAVSTVTVNPLPNLIVNSISSCAGQPATLTALGNATSFLWNTAANTAAITVFPTATTSYTVTGTALGCSTTASATITVYQFPVISVNSVTVCAGTSAVLTANGALAYSWNTGSTSNNIVVIPDTTTTYTVTGTSNGCSSSGTGTVTVNVVPVAEFTAPLTSLITFPVVNFTNLSTNSTMWSWNFGDTGMPNNFSSAKNPTHEYSQIGSYCVLLTASNANCSDTVTHCISIEGVFTFYIPDAFTPNGDGVNDEFYGLGESITSYEMRIFDRWGNLLFYGDDLSKHWDGTYMGNLVQDGVYVYVVNLKDNHKEDHKYIGSVTVLK